MDFGSTLQEKLGEHEPEEIEELILDNLFQQDDSLTKNQKETLEKYKSLIHLGMNGIGIKSLKNMPKIESLQILELSENKLTGSDFSEIVSLYPNLYKIKLANNQIASIDTLKSLQKLKIKKIYLDSNPCSGDKSYISEVFKIFPELISVDLESKDGEQVDSTIYEGEEEDNDIGEDEQEFDDEDEDGGEDEDEFNEDDEEDDEDEDDDDEDVDDEGAKPSKKKKQ